MAITKATGYKASDGVVYATVEEAQQAELRAVLKPILQRVWESENTHGSADDNGAGYLHTLANELLMSGDLLLSILTTGPRSRPKARKAAATTNPRRAAKRATPAQAQEGFRDMREAVDAVVPMLAAQ